MTDEEPHWTIHVSGWKIARVLGFGALIAGGLTIAATLLAFAALIAPLIFWFAWNVLDFGAAVGLPELGLWATLLATLFLLVGWFGKVAIAGLVFLINPDWFQGEALMRWPEPTLKHFIAILLLAGLAAAPHASDSSEKKASNRKKEWQHV